MFSIHVFNVKLGDSIVIETNQGKESFFSIIDCKKIGNKTPIVEFLEEKNIVNLESLFITHYHQDHCSGLPDLRDYLYKVNGTLEFFISPYLPDEIDFREKIKERLFKNLYDETSISNLKEILKAINDIKKLSSRNNGKQKVFSVRILFEGDTTESAWKSYIHPGLFFAFVNPRPEESFKYLKSILVKAETDGKSINSMSHAFIIRYDISDKKIISFFTGDLEGSSWRAVKNRCLEITKNSIKKNLNFLKIPHHGGFNTAMTICLDEMVDHSTPFVASISCPPLDIYHPSEQLLNFLKGKFNNCLIACTNISISCKEKGFPFNNADIFEQSAKEADFLDCITSDKKTLMLNAGACAGAHIFKVIDEGFNLIRSTGTSCNFHKTN